VGASEPSKSCARQWQWTREGGADELTHVAYGPISRSRVLSSTLRTLGNQTISLRSVAQRRLPDVLRQRGSLTALVDLCRGDLVLDLVGDN